MLCEPRGFRLIVALKSRSGWRPEHLGHALVQQQRDGNNGGGRDRCARCPQVPVPRLVPANAGQAHLSHARVPTAADNELVLSVDVWMRHLPRIVAAIFAPAWAGQRDVDAAVSVHRRFRSAFNLTAEELPLLRYSPWAEDDEAFSLLETG